MFVKVTTSGPRRYVKIVESYRDAKGVPRQRIIATLGRLEAVETGSANALIDGLLRVSGQASLAEGTGRVEFAPARTVGDTWLLHALWQQLGFHKAFRRLLRNARSSFDTERLLRVMVFNRLCDPESKLGVLRWLEGTTVPGVPAEEVTHQRLLRGMDTLADRSASFEAVLAGLLRPLVDQDLSIVFYDLTTLRVEGQSVVDADLRRYGMSKEGDIARQCLLGIVQTADGLPIYHEVFAGNTAETTTLVPTIERVLSRFPIRRVVLVADRGLLSLDNLEELQKIRIDDRPLEFILAVPGRRYGEFAELLRDFQNNTCASAQEEVVGETPWQGLRLVMAHNPTAAAELTAARDEQIKALERKAQRWAGKLDSQDAGARYRGRKLSDGGVMARFHQAVSDAKLSRIIKLDLSSDWFSYDIDEKALTSARLIDGKLLLVTNVTDLAPTEIVCRYKALADIERGFRVLKSEIEIAPIFHRLPDRIRAHALICFLALVLYRVLRMRLKAKDSPYSPERALEITRRIQLHQVRLHNRHNAQGISTLTPEQQDLFTAIDLPVPTHSAVKTSV